MEKHFFSKKSIKNKIAKIKRKKKNGNKIIFTNGVFDLFHIGHLNILRYAKSFEGVVVVGVNSDSSAKIKRKPIINENDRAVILSSLIYVDYVIPFREETPELLVEKIRPHILLKGSDYKDKKIAGERYADKIVFFARTAQSTSNIIEKIKNEYKCKDCFSIQEMPRRLLEGRCPNHFLMHTLDKIGLGKFISENTWKLFLPEWDRYVQINPKATDISNKITSIICEKKEIKNG